MNKKDRLANEMYPKALRDTGHRSCQPGATLADVVQQVCDDLSASEIEEFAATVIISELQMELQRAHKMLCRLKNDVSYAEDVFAETCDCSINEHFEGNLCEPCKKLKVFRRHLKEAKLQIDRCSLCI